MTPQTIPMPQRAAWPTILPEDRPESILAAKLMRAKFELRDRENTDRMLKAFDRLR